MTTGAQVLAVEMGENDAEAKTVREYLVKLAAEVWKEGESFSGKRPFGNSGWQGEIEFALVKAGLASGTICEDGNFADDVDDEEISKLVLLALKELAVPSQAAPNV